MKKLFLALGALATLSMVAPSCGGDNKTPNNNTNTNTTVTVQELSVNPTSLSLYVGDKVTFGLSKTDVVVTLVPNTATYTIESDKPAVVKVDGKNATAVGAGNATITLKAGDKTATIAVTVAEKASFDKERFLDRIYVPVFDGNMKAKKAEIEAAMTSAGNWVSKVFPNEKQKDQIYFFQLADGVQYILGDVRYVHSPGKGKPFISCVGIYEGPGTWEKGHGVKMMEQLGFAKENLKEGKLDNGRPYYLAANDKLGCLVAVFNEEVDSKDGKKYDIYTVEIFEREQAQSTHTLNMSKSIGLSIFNPFGGLLKL